MIEFLKQPGVYECFWLLSGFLICKILSSMLGIVHIHRYVKNINLSCFSMIMITFASLVRGVELKKDIMVESEVEKLIIDNVIKSDCERLNTWKDAALQNLHTFSPIAFKELQETMDKKRL